MAFIGTLWNNRLAFCKNPTIVYKCANRFLTKGSKAESQYVASTGGSLLLIGQDGQVYGRAKACIGCNMISSSPFLLAIIPFSSQSSCRPEQDRSTLAAEEAWSPT